jgi:hypothetical protein
VVALAEVAAELAQAPHLVGVLDPLGDRRHPEGVGQVMMAATIAESSWSVDEQCGGDADGGQPGGEQEHGEGKALSRAFPVPVPAELVTLLPGAVPG